MVPRKRSARMGSDDWMEGKRLWKDWWLRAALATPCCSGQPWSWSSQEQNEQDQGPPCLLLRSFPKHSATGLSRDSSFLSGRHCSCLAVSSGPTSELTQSSLPLSSFRTGYVPVLCTFPFIIPLTWSWVHLWSPSECTAQGPTQRWCLVNPY